MDDEVKSYNEGYCFSEILTQDFLSSYFLKNPKWGFNGLGYIVYKRTYARKIAEGISEEWWQTVARCINGAQKIGARYTKEEAERLFDLVFNLKCNFAGRMLWQLGTSTVDRFGLASLLNCWYVSMREIEDFCFVFEHLMLGGGVGFSVRREDIHELPRVKRGVKITHNKDKDADFIVPDSRQGWVELLRKVIQSFFVTGKSFSYSTILVRGSGEPIKGFGGTASGPQILVEGLESIAGVLKNREGKKLRSVDVLDINNIIGDIVVAGNVRRSAEIAVGDADDYLYIRAKNWSNGSIPNWRGKSNNSIDADTFKHISDEIWDNGYTIDPKTGLAKGEPYGFINMKLCQKFGRIGEEKRDNCEGVNPSMPAGVLVATTKGIFEIQDLVDQEFFVKSLDGTFAKAKCFYSGNKPVYKINLGKHKDTFSTKEHKWPVLKNGQIQKVETSDLKVGDLIPLNLNEEIGIAGNTNLTYDEGFLVGTILGDGWISKRSTSDRYSAGICFSLQERERAEKVLGIVNSLKPNQSSISVEKDSLTIQFTDKQFIEKLLNYYGIPLSAEKDIPSSVWKSNDTYIKGFVDGLISADGNVETDQSICLATSRKNLAVNFSKLMSFYGIPTSIYGRDCSCSFPNKKDYDKTYQSWRVKVSIGNIVKFNNLFSLSEKSKQNRIQDSLEASSKCANRKELSYAVVKDIELQAPEDVWDITVYHEQHVFPSQYCFTGNCAEITLADGEACNLSELYLNNISSKEELIECAKLLYKTQKAVWNLPAIYEKTDKIVKKNRRIGLGVTGICQSFEKLDWLDECYNELKKFDQSWSKELNIPESIKLTTVKPSGTLSLLGGATAGVHPAYSRFFIRRVRMASSDPLIKLCRDAGYKTEYVRRFDGSEDYGTTVVEFPCEFEKDTITADKMGAVDQLELTKKLQKIWADNSVSVTVYYQPEELESIKAWMKDNYEKNMKTLSFLMHSKHGFIQAPLEEISEEEYHKQIKKVKPIETMFDVGSEILEGMECESGACPLR
jgi:hypothetical protein